MFMNFFNPSLFIQMSPWPVCLAFAGFLSVIGLIFMMHLKFFFVFFMSLIIFLLIVFQWVRDFVREASLAGGHTFLIQKGLKIGMLLFIASEVLFFVGFFWAFFHSSISPAIEVGNMWPPFFILAINPFGIPLLNTIILLSSGVTVTWSHHSLREQNLLQMKISIFFTIILGWIFLKIQVSEYISSNFTISDSIFGSSFFMATGFHGFHVFMGSILLLICLIRSLFFHFSNLHHVGFEAAIWYWHFVDVVWLFLFCFVYWWAF